MFDLVRLLDEGRAWRELLPPTHAAAPSGQPGGIVALRHEGHTTALALGLADLEHRAPISGDTVFDCASIAKQFTAAAVLRLRAAGLIGLDEELLGHVPELGATYAGITVRHLLFHTSGIRDYQQLLALAGARRSDYFRTADVLGLLARQRSLLHRCGTRHVYSNSNYLLLAQIVERASPQGFAAFLRDTVLEPAGLRRTRMRDDLATVVAGRASSYTWQDGEGYRTEHTPSDAVGDSGLLSTAHDLLAWASCLRAEAVGNEGSPLAMLGSRGALDDGSPLDYGFGLFHRRWNGIVGIGHGGSFDGFRSELIVLPERELDVVVLTNWPADAARVAAAVVERACAVLDMPPRSVAPRADPWPAVLIDADGLAWELQEGRDEQFVLLSPRAQVVLRVRGPDLLTGEWDGKAVMVSRTGGRVSIAVGEHRWGAEPDQRVAPAAADLSGLLGRYWSDELMTAATVSVEGSALRWRRRSAVEPLDRITGDQFRAGGTWVRFRRHHGVADELEVTTPRASGIVFRRAD